MYSEADRYRQEKIRRDRLTKGDREMDEERQKKRRRKTRQPDNSIKHGFEIFLLPSLPFRPFTYFRHNT